MHGVGRTVFAGNRVDDFQVEILGVLDNIGPKEALILARLSGGPLEHTGVMQGMSGSPVYIDGKLVGAVAMAFPFSKDPIAAIRPIEDMVRAAGGAALAADPSRRPAIALADRDLTRPFSKPASLASGEARMVNIATPISFGGFSQRHPGGLRPTTARAGTGAAPGYRRRRQAGTRHGQSGRPQARLHDQHGTHVGRPQHGRRWHRHLHRRPAHLRLRPSLSRCRRHGHAVRPRRGDRADAQSQHLLQTLGRQGMDGHHQPGPQHGDGRASWASAPPWRRSR